eukprot:GHVR01068856.1.p1 GENE.GHVR01068856.1~~GHVR01068856.1.p1  ORF type:complete len:128 (+),score=86.08 GHVR01068856.1:114-497(+)
MNNKSLIEIDTREDESKDSSEKSALNFLGTPIRSTTPILFKNTNTNIYNKNIYNHMTTKSGDTTHTADSTTHTGDTPPHTHTHTHTHKGIPLGIINKSNTHTHTPIIYIHAHTPIIHTHTHTYIIYT